MTAPLAAAAARPAAAPAVDGGSPESAAPFASALDGALSENRGAVGEDDGESPAEATPDENPVPAGEPLTDVPAAAVAAAVWALALGQTTAAVASAEGETALPRGEAVSAGVGHAPGTPPGLAVAAARAQGEAKGLGAVVEGEAPAPGPVPAGAPVRPTTGGPPPSAAAQAQARLQAALDAAATTGTTAPAVVVAEVDAAGFMAPGPTAPADDAPAPTAGPTFPPVPSPAAAPLGGALSADADAGQGSAGSGSPSGDSGTEVTPAGVGAPAASATTPVNDADTATGSAATQPVSAQVARQVAVLRGAADGSHTMTLVLTPETLGPVEVSVTVTSGTVDLTLRGANEHGRAALLDALPDLRRDLELAGLSVAKAEVDRDTGGSRFSDQTAQYADRQQAFGDRGAQDRGNSRSRPWLGVADTPGEPTPAAQRTASSGVDVRV